jgi:ATP-dependent Clp protease ATP-binding subunit ClpC
MFERFTDQAWRVVVLAEEEARRLDHNWIGTEHLLLGLIREGDGMAAQVLVSPWLAGSGRAMPAARRRDRAAPRPAPPARH